MTREHVRALIERGNVTLDEIENLRCTSEEWHALYPAMTNKALFHMTRHVLKNCTPVRRRGQPVTYDEVLQAIVVPELLRRLRDPQPDTEPAPPAEDVPRSPWMPEPESDEDHDAWKSSR